MRKLRHGKVKFLSPGQTAGVEQCWAGLLDISTADPEEEGMGGPS